MIKLSIIVPIYNVERYLNRCVDSILDQTFTDFEVILVDDGSPDRCPTICDEFLEKDPRVRVIHKENGGISDARNAALDITRGEYIGFVDSDDYIAPDMYQVLVENADRTNADISAMGYVEVYENGEIHKYCSSVTEDRIYSKDDYIGHFFPDIRWHIMPSLCNKIFKREVFSQIRFPVGKIYEDSFTQLPIYELCSMITVSPKFGYFYTIARPDSIMNATFSEKRLQLIELGESQLRYFADRGLQEQYQYALAEYVDKYLKLLFGVHRCAPDLAPKLKPYTKNFRNLFWHILRCTRICKLKKLVVILSQCFPQIAYRISLKTFPECIMQECR